jgi:hypothetical protein
VVELVGVGRIAALEYRLLVEDEMVDGINDVLGRVKVGKVDAAREDLIRRPKQANSCPPSQTVIAKTTSHRRVEG